MKNPIIRTIYLYLFALIGLGMLVVGLSMLINIGLKTWVFTKADSQDNYIERPMPMYIAEDLGIKTVQELQICSDECELTETQKEHIAAWLEDYEEWKDNSKNQDTVSYTVRNRQRQASTAISLILVGLPLWVFHWALIKRDVGQKNS